MINPNIVFSSMDRMPWARAALALFVLLVINAIFTRNFLSTQTLLLNLTQVAPIVIVAIGMSIVVASGGIDLSVGSLMAIGGALAPLVLQAQIGPNYEVWIALAIVLPMLAAAAAGMLNGLLVTRVKIQPIVATLILFIAGRGIAQVLTNGNLQVINDPVLRYIGLGRPMGIPIQVILTLAIVLIFMWLLRSTVFGRQLIAVGGNEAAARLCGVAVHRVKTLAYVICGALSGLAGLIVVGINSSSDANQVGLNMELDAIAAVAVGGTALAGGRVSVFGTLIGALIMQLIRTTLLSWGVAEEVALVVKAVIIVAAVWLQHKAARPQVTHAAQLSSSRHNMAAIGRNGVMIALVLLLALGAIRYEGLIGAYNLQSVVRYNSMFAFIALGMAFVIISGGIDLSVGSVAALSSVVAATMSQHGMAVGILVPLLCASLLGLINGLVITRLRIAPFVATLAMLLAARGLALIAAGNVSVSANAENGFIDIGQGDFLGLPIPGVMMVLAFALGWFGLERSVFGRHVLAVGGNEDASRLLGVHVERTQLIVYTISGLCAGIAGVILASQFGAGQPTEGLGWELSAIASVVVGGTLLTGGLGTMGGTLAGALLLGLIFNMLNFENGLGFISLSAYWQSVIRGAFLLFVVLLQRRLQGRANTP
jgi:galactofuranose transport system permease protein